MAGMYDIDKQYFISILFFLSSSSPGQWKSPSERGAGNTGLKGGDRGCGGVGREVDLEGWMLDAEFMQEASLGVEELECGAEA